MPDKYKYKKIPYLMDILKDLTPDSKTQTITIMKHSSCGCSEMMIKNIPEFISKKGLYHAR